MDRIGVNLPILVQLNDKWIENLVMWYKLTFAFCRKREPRNLSMVSLF